MKKALMFILMMLIATVFLTSCNFNKQPKNGDEKKDDGGWKVIETVNTTEVYTLLIASTMNSLEDMSSRKVNNTYPQLSVDTRLKIELNDFILWLELKLNYDHKNPDALLISLEIINDETKAVLLGAYFKDNQIYLKVMDGDGGKLKFPLQNSVINDFLPLTFDKIDVPKMSIFLNGILEMNNNITGRSRMNGTLTEYEYSMNIDLPTTLRKLVTAIDDDIIENLNKEQLSLIIQRIMGVTFDDILNRKLPPCDMEVNFSALGNKLQTFDMRLTVEQDDNIQNTLFGGDVIDVALSLEKLKIGNTFTSIPFFGDNEYKNYPDYIDQTFGLLLNVKQKGATAAQDINYLLKSEFKLDLDVVENNQLSFEVLNDSNKPITGVYIYDNMFYFYQLNEDTQDYEKKLEFEFDIVDIYNKVKKGVKITVPNQGDEEALNADAELDDTNKALEFVAFFVGAIRITKDKLSFTISEEFYQTVIPGFENFILYADEVIDVDLQEMLDEQNIDIVGYLMSRTFEIFIDLSEESTSFIYILEGEIDFPDGVDGKPQSVD